MTSFNWAIIWIFIVEETSIAWCNNITVLWRVMILYFLWSKWNLFYRHSLQTFTCLLNFNETLNGLWSQYLSVSDFLTCNALQAEIFFMSLPDFTCWSDWIWKTLLHDNISSSILCLAIFLKKNTSILVLKHAVRSHVSVCCLEEWSVSHSNFPVSRIITEIGDLFLKWSRDDIIAESTDVSLFTDVIVNRNLLFSVCANDAHFLFPTFLSVRINVKLNFSTGRKKHHVSNTCNWSITPWKILCTWSNWANDRVNWTKNFFVPGGWNGVSQLVAVRNFESFK